MNSDPPPAESVSPAPGYFRFFPLRPGDTREEIERRVLDHLATIDSGLLDGSVHCGATQEPDEEDETLLEESPDSLV